MSITLGIERTRITATLLCVLVVTACLALLPLGNASTVGLPSHLKLRGNIVQHVKVTSILRKLMSIDSKIPNSLFYKYYVAGKTIVVKASELKPILGMPTLFVHVLTYIHGKGWVNVPIKIYKKCYSVNKGAAEYCMIPRRIDQDTKIIIKVPPSLPSIPLPKLSRWTRATGEIRSAYRLSILAGYPGRLFTLHYMVVVSNIPNPWVIKEQSRFKSVEDGFDGWGIQGFVDRVLSAVHRNVIPINILPELIKYYASVPLQYSRINIVPANLKHVVSNHLPKPSGITTKHLKSAKLPEIISPSTQQTSGTTFILELIPPLRTWGTKGSLTLGTLTLTATYKLIPQIDVMGYPTTVSLTPAILVLRHSNFGFAKVVVRFYCNNKLVSSDTYDVYKSHSVLRPTLYWPPGNIVTIKISLSGTGEWSASIIGMTAVQLVEKAPIMKSRLRKELELYVLGSPSDRGPSTFIDIPVGASSGRALAYLPVPFDLALDSDMFFNSNEYSSLSFTVHNSGNANAYVTVCFAGECSSSVLVRHGQTKVISINNILAFSINSYYWFQKPIPIMVLAKKASSSGAVALSIKPRGVLVLFARPTRPTYRGTYTDSTLYKDNCGWAWHSYQEFRGGFIATYAGYIKDIGGSSALVGWFGTNSEGYATPYINELQVDAALLFIGTVRASEPYGLSRMKITLTGSGVAKGRAAILLFNRGSSIPELPEIPPPLALGTSLVSLAGFEILDVATITYSAVSWIWNALCSYTKNYATVKKGSDSVSYTWIHGPLAPVVKYMIFEVSDGNVGVYAPTSIGVLAEVSANEVYAPYMPVDSSPSANIEIAATPP